MQIISIYILLFLFSVNLLGNSKIVNIEIIPKVDQIQLIVKLDSEYSGVVVQKSGNIFQKIVLNGAMISKRYSKTMNENSIISKVDILPFPNRTDILIFSIDDINIEFFKSEDQTSVKIIISENIIASQSKIELEGKSLFLNLSSGYIITLTILILLVVVAFFIRKKLEGKLKFNKNEENSLNWLLDKDNTRISLKSIQVPDINFKTRKNPNNLEIDSTLDKPVKTAESKDIKIEEKKALKSLKSSKNIEVVFDEDINRGRVFMLNIANRKYLLLESPEGETTLLDKFEKSNKGVKQKEKVKKSEHKLVMPLNKRESAIIERDYDLKLSTETEKEITPNVSKISSKDVGNDLKDFFKDSKNLKI